MRATSLATRILLATALLAAIVATVFAALVYAVSGMRDAIEREAHAKDATAATLRLEKLVLDLDTGFRGLVITNDLRFLQPWEEARKQLPEQLARFQRLARDEPAQARRARELVRLIREYVIEYSEPLVYLARSPERAAVQGTLPIAEGNMRTAIIRERFTEFLAAENARAAESADAAGERSDRAIALGVIGLVASAAFIVVFGVYFARSVGRPVREVAAGASRVAGGDLSARMEEGGPGEVGELTRSFNSMAADLDRQRRELHSQNEELRRSERLKSELVNIVSHEVRTPLASVLGFTSVLLRREVGPDERRRFLEIIDTQGRRLAALLDDFLDVQRLEEGRLELSQELVDVAALLEEQAQLFTAQSEKHRLELKTERPLAVRGDPGRLTQVVGNLLSNAIKYSPEGGVVRIVGEREDGSVRVSVRDEGVGIADGYRDRIFTKFFRGDAAASGIPGSGLGLAFARAVVEAHGGRMDFESAEGRGSTFWVELPTAPTESP